MFSNFFCVNHEKFWKFFFTLKSFLSARIIKNMPKILNTFIKYF